MAVEQVIESDVLVIGGGFAGCKLLYSLRKLGFKVKLVEAGSDLGGVWHWNSYPGARVDSDYRIYGLDTPEVWETWDWTELYPGQSELQAYFQHVGKVCDLKKDCTFNAKIVKATFNDKENTWTAESDNGIVFRSQFMISAQGFAAKRHIPDWEGLDSFKGVMQHSSYWDPSVDLKGKKVAVVGQGATGIQIVQEVGKIAGELKVFIRNPIYGLPMRQAKLTLEKQREERQMYKEWYKHRYTTGGGFLFADPEFLSTDHNDEEREKYLESLWNEGGFLLFGVGYKDTPVDLTSNRLVYDFWRRKVRARIQDPAKQDILAPLEPPYPITSKRPSLEQDYYDQFNKDHVHLVNVKETPIVKVVPEGLVTSDGKTHELDVIVLATGYDSVTGGIRAIDIVGADGTSLNSKWSEGTLTWIGMATAGFPNFFFTYGPQAPTALSSGPSSIEPQCDWIADLLVYMRDQKKNRIDAVKEREPEWQGLCQLYEDMTVRKGIASSYNGGNIPGKRREALNWGGGIPDYIKRCKEVAAAGYDGFVLA